ncbi:MAG: GNAT family N-acetyltransferase [Pseudolysinimonas sp.]|uniref:GNAT family N-acetyltransferase n=1 Tax=Pseudolysinimonas sp. TaxID=2680009 RepID=UPI00326534F6
MTLRLERRRDPAGVDAILTSLPEWFGDPDAIANYVADAADPGFDSLLVREGDRTVGVALIRRHFSESAELHLIAVAPHLRRTGAGRALVAEAARNLRADGCILLSVHTVGPSYENAAYFGTRAFYAAIGFLPLEEHEGLDWAGPTLILVMPLATPRWPAPDSQPSAR